MIHWTTNGQLFDYGFYKNVKLIRTYRGARNRIAVLEDSKGNEMEVYEALFIKHAKPIKLEGEGNERSKPGRRNN